MGAYGATWGLWRWGCSAVLRSVLTSAAGSSGARTSAPRTRSLGAAAWRRGSDTPWATASAPAVCKEEAASGFYLGTTLLPAVVSSGQEEGTGSACSQPDVEERAGCLVCPCCLDSCGVSYSEKRWRLLSGLQSEIHREVGTAWGSPWVCPGLESSCRRKKRSARSWCPQNWTETGAEGSTVVNAAWFQVGIDAGAACRDLRGYCPQLMACFWEVWGDTKQEMNFVGECLDGCMVVVEIYWLLLTHPCWIPNKSLCWVLSILLFMFRCIFFLSLKSGNVLTNLKDWENCRRTCSSGVEGALVEWLFRREELFLKWVGRALLLSKDTLVGAGLLHTTTTTTTTERLVSLYFRVNRCSQHLLLFPERYAKQKMTK